jgi:putative flavoprotein involved in K+ transport
MYADVVIIGAGHSGLAMSAFLSQHCVDHVVLERGQVANSWRRERWESLRLLTPNWLSRLPGHRYDGDDPHGFMALPEVIAFIEHYARLIAAPVRTGVTVMSVTERDDRYHVITDADDWFCRCLVIANGAHGVANVPPAAARLPPFVRSLTAKEYRRPQDLDDRGVLVVGASATGVQLADEIQRSGRQVTLAVGEHIRLPRRYRGRDIQAWMETLGLLDQRIDHVDDLVRVRRLPSPQLVGAPATLDLNALTERGVELVGRLEAVRDGRALFSGSLRNQCAMADLKQQRLLASIDRWLEQNPYRLEVPEPDRPVATRVPERPRLWLDFKRIGTVLWATGFRPDYSWLHLPVLDAKGQLQHEGGIVGAPGVYALGLNFMRRRKSSFIHGAEDDVRELGYELLAHLDALDVCDEPPSRLEATGWNLVEASFVSP